MRVPRMAIHIDGESEIEADREKEKERGRERGGRERKREREREREKQCERGPREDLGIMEKKRFQRGTKGCSENP